MSKALLIKELFRNEKLVSMSILLLMRLSYKAEATVFEDQLELSGAVEPSYGKVSYNK